MDVLVSSLCVVGAPNRAVSDSTGDVNSAVKPCLVNGVAIRRHSVDLTSHGDSLEENSEVDALNQVNQALTENLHSAEIITQTLPDSSGGSSEPANPFVSYLLVHDITSLGVIAPDRNNTAKSSNNKSKAGGGGTKQLGVGATAAAVDHWKPMPAVGTSSSQQNVHKLGALQSVGVSLSAGSRALHACADDDDDKRAIS